MPINKRDYYEILGVDRGVSEQDLKSAYRRLAVQHHPDKNPDDPQAEDKFKEAAEAYAVLSDPEQRRRYDRFGHAGVSSAAGAAWGAPGFSNIEDILGDLFGFGDVFGAGARAASSKRNRLKSKFLPVSKPVRGCGCSAKASLERTEARPEIYMS